MGMPASARSAVLAPSPALLRHRYGLLSASGITISTLFEMAPMKCFCFVLFFLFVFFLNGQFVKLSYRGKDQTEVGNIPVSCGFVPCGFIYFLNKHMSWINGYTAAEGLLSLCYFVLLKSQKCK